MTEVSSRPTGWRFWRRIPDTLFGRVAGLLVLNILLVQAVTLALYWIETDRLDRPRHELSERVATSIRAIEQTDPADRAHIAASLSLPELAVSIRQHPPPIPPDFAPLGMGLGHRIAERLGEPARVIIVLQPPPPPHFGDRSDDEGGPPLIIAAPLGDGTSIEFRASHPPPAFRWMHVLTFIVAASAIIAGLSLLFARSFTRRLTALAEASEAFGRSVEAPPLSERGPRELSLVSRTFNRMQERLRRFITDRTQMLAAISHDLRTPLTRMRLRAEFVDDEEQRAKMLVDLAEMEEMIAATLAFARDDATRDPPQEMDLDGLLTRLAEELREGGADALYQSGGPITIHGNPTALRRAFGNLLGNAVKFGKRVRVGLSTQAGSIVADIDDDGPGIPADRLEQVFQPFFRLETSRNRDTGGVGLGLSVARTIIRGHGGDLVLSNRPDRGLRATVTLPI